LPTIVIGRIFTSNCINLQVISNLMLKLLSIKLARAARSLSARRKLSENAEFTLVNEQFELSL